ncbi:Uncharacterized protein FKW44_014704, partial [Caligus rogercresseyi]
LVKNSMPFKKSSSTTEKNKETWRMNLVQFQAPSRRGNVAIHEEPLSDRSRMPLKSHVMGRFKSLESIAKERKERVGLIAVELKALWRTTLNFPPVSDQAIRAKLEKLLQEYDHCRKKQNFDSLDELFDVTKVKGQWLCKEDKNLYELQMQSKGQVGYSTGKRASAQTIHPSKRRNTLDVDVSNSATESSSVALDSSETGTDSCDTSEDSSMEDEAAPSTRTRKYNPTGVARRLVTSSKLSTHKAAKVCRQLSGEGIEIRTPSQPGIHKALYRRAAEVKQHLVSTLHQEKWSLHFDGKKINGIEHQAVVLKNEAKEIKLTVLQLKDGTAATIAKGLQDVLQEFNLWGSILMIIADTTSVNTGKKSGVVIRLQQMFEKNGSHRPKFISCQHHVLDRILRIVMDDELHDSTKSPDIEYFFVKDLVRMYDQLKAAFINGKAEIKETGGWRDDMKFLYHLTRVFRHFTEKDEVPFVNFQQIPNISNARWNSRAILALLAFILMPETRTRLRKICSFISYQWAGHWFSNQLFRNEDFEELSSALDGYPKGLKCLETHWKRDESPINIARSNQCCERAIKVMQDLDKSCRNKDNLP